MLPAATATAAAAAGRCAQNTHRPRKPFIPGRALRRRNAQRPDWNARGAPADMAREGKRRGAACRMRLRPTAERQNSAARSVQLATPLRSPPRQQADHVLLVPACCPSPCSSYMTYRPTWRSCCSARGPRWAALLPKACRCSAPYSPSLLATVWQTTRTEWFNGAPQLQSTVTPVRLQEAGSFFLFGREPTIALPPPPLCRRRRSAACCEATSAARSIQSYPASPLRQALVLPNAAACAAVNFVSMGGCQQVMYKRRRVAEQWHGAVQQVVCRMCVFRVH